MGEGLVGKAVLTAVGGLEEEKERTEEGEMEAEGKQEEQETVVESLEVRE